MRVSRLAGRARIAVALGPLVVMAVLAAPACGTSQRGSGTSPRLVVATGLYPLAQAVEQIGQGRASADGIVPAGSDPKTYQPDAAAVSKLAQAGLILLGPAGAQPAVDSVAAKGGRPVVHVAAPSGGTYFWLDPDAMRSAVPQIASAMEKADPRDAATFRSGAVAFEDELRSTAFDYQSTLSTCPRRDVFVPDMAFVQTAKHYGLTVHVVAGVDQPQSTVVRSAVAAIGATGATTVFVQPWTAEQAVRAAASAAGAKVRTLDTLLGAPPAGWPRQATYINLLEANLGALSSALGCPDAGTGA